LSRLYLLKRFNKYYTIISKLIFKVFISFKEILDVLYDSMYDSSTHNRYFLLKKDDNGEWKVEN